MSYIYGYVGGSGVISGNMTGGSKMAEDETMGKYSEAHGCGEMNAERIIEELENICYNNEYILELLSKLKNGIPIRPLPCVRDEHGEIKEQTVKVLFSKINEELDELKTEITYHGIAVIADSAADAKEKLTQPLDIKAIAEEAADTITAITTMLEALGIDAEMLDEAQRRVNSKNRERGRL